FEAKKAHDQLLFLFEQDYPEYYNLKYRELSIKPEDICQKLEPGQCLIEYYITEADTRSGEKDLLHILVFSNKNRMYRSVELPDSFNQAVNDYVSIVGDRNVGETNRVKFQRYIRAACELHDLLIGSLPIPASAKEIIVIPDGPINNIPFDALLAQKPLANRIHFYDLAYLVHDYAFSYSYSSTLHFEYFGSKENREKGIAAFAPDYHHEEVDENKAAFSYPNTRNRSVMKPLPGAKEEVLKISEIQKTDLFLNGNATETQFKQVAGKYDVLHLAMHAILNDSLPMYSKLVFSAQPDSSNDGYLNVEELYSMKLNARLAVLSACNTGTGKRRGGEGVMSMARAFMRAGCPSIMMTLWEVEDRSSADLMVHFYKNLRKGKSKTLSLSLAKRTYLKSADPFSAHPYFWSGYIVLGNTEAMYPNYSWIIALILLIAGAVFWGLRRKGKTKII
ncbi:MAG TPA: CHAT domain-containing protein, partial [Prolixibacteraceae bacterium]|nr:CHAT domain-containing protein [Prolixibacteraceae bacterium]